MSIRRSARAFVVLTALLSMPSCVVSARRYDEAVARAEQARAERVRADKRHAEAQQATERRCEERIAELEQQVAESRYQEDVRKKQLEDEQRMVTQLRGELERVANHLREYAERNQQLSHALTDLEQRGQQLARAQAEAEDQTLLLRDLGSALKDDVQAGVVDLEVTDAGPVVRLVPVRAFLRNHALRDAGKRALTDLGRVAAAGNKRRVELRWEGAPRSELERKTRIEQAALAIIAAGVDRKNVQIAPQPAPLARGAPAPRIAISVRRAAP
jgi:predicted RNase H-like nuclease (RuvC/YqgF family)